MPGKAGREINEVEKASCLSSKCQGNDEVHKQSPCFFSPLQTTKPIQPAVKTPPPQNRWRKKTRCHSAIGACGIILHPAQSVKRYVQMGPSERSPSGPQQSSRCFTTRTGLRWVLYYRAFWLHQLMLSQGHGSRGAGSGCQSTTKSQRA